MRVIPDPATFSRAPTGLLAGSRWVRGGGVRLLTLVLGAILVLMWGTSQVAYAGARACEGIRPEQSLPVEVERELDTLVRARVVGAGSGEVQVERRVTEENAVRLLEGDDLARAWYTFQVCVMREEGAISEVVAAELLRAAFGVATPPSGAAGPVGAVASGGGRFVAHPDQATVVVAQCPERVFHDTTPAIRVPVHYQINGMRVSKSSATGFALDIPPGRLSLSYRLANLRGQSEFVVEAGKIYYFVMDYEFGAMKGLRGVTLRPASGSEGELVLERCLQVDRVER
jgi:hypothetical protein